MSEDLYVEPDPNKIVRFQADDTEYMNIGDHINNGIIYENWSAVRKSEDNTTYDQQKSIYLSVCVTHMYDIHVILPYVIFFFFLLLWYFVFVF